MCQSPSRRQAKGLSLKASEMKTKYKHIIFREYKVETDPHHPVYICRNNRSGDVLGGVEYYQSWRRYVFEGKQGAVFDTSCLADIIDFMKQLGKSDVVKKAVK